MLNYQIKVSGPLFRRNIKRLISEAIKETATYGINRIREKTPVRTGRLKRSWLTENWQENSIRINNYTPYAPFVEKRRTMVAKSIPEIRVALFTNVVTKLRQLQ